MPRSSCTPSQEHQLQLFDLRLRQGSCADGQFDQYESPAHVSVHRGRAMVARQILLCLAAETVALQEQGTPLRTFSPEQEYIPGACPEALVPWETPVISPRKLSEEEQFQQLVAYYEPKELTVSKPTPTSLRFRSGSHRARRGEKDWRERALERHKEGVSLPYKD